MYYSPLHKRNLKITLHLSFCNFLKRLLFSNTSIHCFQNIMVIILLQVFILLVINIFVSCTAIIFSTFCLNKCRNEISLDLFLTRSLNQMLSLIDFEQRIDKIFIRKCLINLYLRIEWIGTLECFIGKRTISHWKIFIIMIKYVQLEFVIEQYDALANGYGFQIFLIKEWVFWLKFCMLLLTKPTPNDIMIYLGTCLPYNYSNVHKIQLLSDMLSYFVRSHLKNVWEI